MSELPSYQPGGITTMNTTPVVLNKAGMRKYEDLEVPCDAILASYVWVDGSGVNLRSKDRTFDFIPKTHKDLPIWYFDGSNTAQANPDNSDTFIFPQVIYHDPFRRGNHILVLADTYQHNYQPTATNFRKTCVMLCEKGEVEEPWFGFNQEFFLTTTDGRPLGWPAGGFPAPPGPYYCATGANKIVARDLMEAFYRYFLSFHLLSKQEPWFSHNQEFFLNMTDGRPLSWPADGFSVPPGPYYCATGANKIVARDLREAFYRCCLYAGVTLNGINPGTTPSQWNFQVGPSPGLRAADDLWMARYILARLAEEYGTVATFEPQPVPDWPGNGTFVYFSTKDMRIDDGILVIERAIDKLARRHGAHINEYDANNGADNARRLTGKNGMPHIRDFTAGVANRSCSVRIPRQVSEDKKGYLEDRRPAANADPYRVICIMLRTCIFDE